MNHALIYPAIYAVAAKAPGFVTLERKLKHYARYTRPEMFPVLNFDHGDETARPMMNGGPTQWTLRPSFWLYFWAGDDNVTPDDQINAALDYMVTAFSPVNDMPQTLGGLVNEVNIDGTIKVFEVADAPIQIAVIPLVVVTG
jgi:hypothetical protein